MKFLPYQSPNGLIFRVEIAPQENPKNRHYPEWDYRKSSWEVVDTDLNLHDLFARHQMLSLTDREIIYAKAQLRDMDERTVAYCYDQAKKISRFADDPLQRIASNIYHPTLLADESIYGLSPKIRRLALAVALELGVTTF